MCTPKMLTWVRQLKASAKLISSVKLHPTLIIQAVLILNLFCDYCVVACLKHGNSTDLIMICFMLHDIAQDSKSLA